MAALERSGLRVSRGHRGVDLARGLGLAAWPATVLVFYYVQVSRAVVHGQWPDGLNVLAVLVPLLLLGFGLVLGRRARCFSGEQLANMVPDGAGAAWLSIAGAATIPWLLLWPRVTPLVQHLGLPHFPFAGEAGARLLGGLTGAFLMCAALVGSGGLVLRAIGWSSRSRLESFAFAAVSGVVVVADGSAILSLFGRYRPLPVAGLIAALCFAAVTLARIRPAPRRLPPVDPRRADRIGGWTLLSLIALGYAFLAALAPEVEYDALWYHLNLPHLWLKAGRPVDLVQEYVSLYPLTWELLYGDALVLGGVTAAKLLHFLCLPLLASIVWQAARRYTPSASASVAVALLVTTPTLLWEAGTAYIDVALALHVAAACYALSRYAEEQQRAWALLAALQFGTAAATKHLGVVLTIIPLALYAVGRFRHGCGWPSALRQTLAIGALASVVPLPWYVRAWHASGNPVFPELFSVFGASPEGRWDAITEQGLAAFKAHFGLGRSVEALFALPWNVTIHGALFGGCLGPLFLILLPCLLLVRDRRRAIPWLVAGTLAYLAFWASPVSSFQLRFLMPIVPALALLGAEGLGAAAAFVGRGTGDWRIVSVTALALAILNLPPFIALHEADRAGWEGWLTHVQRSVPLDVVVGRESESSYLAREVPSYFAWRSINSRPATDARVLTFTGGDRLFAEPPYVPHDATMAREAVAAPSGDTAAAMVALRRLGITHILFDNRELTRLHGERLAIGSPAFAAVCATEFADRRFRVCRMDYSGLERTATGGRAATPAPSGGRVP